MYFSQSLIHSVPVYPLLQTKFNDKSTSLNTLQKTVAKKNQQLFPSLELAFLMHHRDHMQTLGVLLGLGIELHHFRNVLRHLGLHFSKTKCLSLIFHGNQFLCVRNNCWHSSSLNIISPEAQVLNLPRRQLGRYCCFDFSVIIPGMMALATPISVSNPIKARKLKVEGGKEER